MIDHRETICTKSYESVVVFLSFFCFGVVVFFLIWALRPLNIISLILSSEIVWFPENTKKRKDKKKKQKKKNTWPPAKQNFACPTWDSSQARIHSGEMIQRLRALYTS